MKKEYTFWHRSNGVRYFDRFINPKAINIQDLPRFSIYHHVDETGASPDVDAQNPLFSGYNKRIIVETVTQYAKENGPVRKPAFQLKEAQRPWRQKNMRTFELRPREDWLSVQSPETLIVLNYGYLPHIYKYLDVAGAVYYKWENLWRTIWTNIGEIARLTDRCQFIEIPLPGLIRGKTILDKMQTRDNVLELTRVFGQEGSAGFNQLDMWRWLSVQLRDKSLMSAVPKDKYSKIVLIFKGTTGDRIAINLAYINSWIRGQSNMTEFGSVVSFTPEMIQKAYLKAAMALNSLSLEGEPVEDVGQTVAQPVGVKVSQELSASDPEENEENTEEDTSPEVVTPTLSHAVSSKASRTSKAFKEPDALPEPPKTADADAFAELEKDIQALDYMSLKRLKNQGVTLVDKNVGANVTTAPGTAPEMNGESAEPETTYEELVERVSKPVSPTERLSKLISEEAESNLLTAAEYRRLNEQIENYRKSEDPYGSGKTRAEAMEITPEDVTISKEATQIPVGDEVPDKTMAESTLIDYDYRYINNVLQKDILQVIDAVQAEGITIRNHEIEVKETVLGSYETHTLELKPVKGMPSTIHFTFPKIDDEGIITASGNRYLLRKQVVDKILRKIAPQIVGLSTYHSKLFVRTSPKQAKSSARWLIRQINLEGMNGNGIVKTLSPGNVFDPDFDSPYIYGVLASDFEEIELKGKKLQFGEQNRKTVNPDLLKVIEKKGRRWCGWTKDMSPIVVDKDDVFHVVTKDGESRLGTITQVLGISAEKQPMDFAEVSVFSKYVPVGLVLAYYLGFENLLKLLKAPYRIVEGRKQKNLEEGEYFVSFKDKSYIFKRGNRVTDLILSGFDEFDKVLKTYDAELFNHKDVYLNVLMTKGLSANYIRQLDSLESSFIDPISFRILAQMKEPQTFIGLLLRSCEMLTTYTHPRSQALTSMHIRGYERFAGQLYRELMLSIRAFKNQNMVGRSKINISPYQVWNSIMSDSAIKIIEDINPIQNLKESEIVTYGGTGGRNRETMTKPTRAYDPDNFGVISQDTVDNAGTGTVAYLSANPNLKDVRGIVTDDKELNPTRITSTATLLSPAAMQDNQSYLRIARFVRLETSGTYSL